MNSRVAKKLRKEVKKTRIRAETLFMQSVARAPFWERVRFGLMVIFKRFDK